MISFNFWLSIFLLSLMALLSGAIALVVLWAAPRRKLNIFFACFSTLVLFWALFSAFMRLQLWYGDQPTQIFQELSILTTALAAPFLLLFISQYFKRLDPIVLVASYFALMYGVAAVLFFPEGSALSNFRLIDGWLLRYDFSGFGLVNTLVYILLLFWCLAKILREWRVDVNARKDPVTIGILIFILGFLFGGMTLVPLPLMLFTNTIAVLILGSAVMRMQVFNPLRERSIALEKEAERRRKVQDELKKSEKKYRTFIEGSNQGIIVYQDNRFVYFNPRSQEITGINLEQGRRMYVFDWIHPDDRKNIAKITKRLQKGEITSASMINRFRHMDGGYRTIENRSIAITWEGRPAVLSMITDITDRLEDERERERLRAKLQQQQKLESIGTLASGVAHEINNPLTGIINYAQLIHDDVEDPILKEFSQGIMKEGDRVSRIVRNLLAFSRQEKEHHSPASIKDVIDNSMSLMGNILRKDQIQVEIVIQDGLPRIKCRSQQLQQVIINLLTNARSALNERYPKYDENKIIRISATLVKLHGKDYIRVMVEDRGSGIPKNILDRIFDPFFTTKTRDEGTGLGLSVSYGIIKDHGGELRVERRVESCTRFIIELPVNNGWNLEMKNENGVAGQ